MEKANPTIYFETEINKLKIILCGEMQHGTFPYPVFEFHDFVLHSNFFIELLVHILHCNCYTCVCLGAHVKFLQTATKQSIDTMQISPVYGVCPFKFDRPHSDTKQA